MDGKFFTDKTKDGLVKIIDDNIKGNVLVEMIDGPLARAAVNVVDSYGDKHIPDKYDDKINLAVNMALDGDYENASQQAGEILDDVIDLQKVDDSTEKLIFVDGLKFIVRQIIYFIERRKKNEEAVQD